MRFHFPQQRMEILRKSKICVEQVQEFSMSLVVRISALSSIKLIPRLCDATAHKDCTGLDRVHD